MTYTNGVTITTGSKGADNNTVFYIGIDNPVTVKAQNVKPEDLVVTISEGKISGTNGSYLVQVTHEGEVELAISKSDGTKLPGPFIYKVKALPDPNMVNILAGQRERLLYDSSLLIKLDYAGKAKIVEGRKLQEINLAKDEQQLELASINYAEKELLVKAARVNSELSVAGRKLEEQEIQKLKQQYLFQKNANATANERYVEGMLLSQDKAEEYRKQLAEIEVQGRPANDLIFTKVEVNPRFNGGEDAWRAYLIKNLKASTPVTEGWKAGKYTVIVSFIVHADGTVSNVVTENYKGTKTARHCIEIIENGPKWLPAIQNGKKVNAFKKQPITFVIE